MIRRIKNLKDVVDWGLCVGCGACYYYCEEKVVALEDIEDVGIRPRFKEDQCGSCYECLTFCPGITVNAHDQSLGGEGKLKVQDQELIGPYVSIWEGYAADSIIREEASSGGLLSALSLYCLDNKAASFVVHTGAKNDRPWSNETVISRTREDLVSRTGSRYAPSSPCDGLGLIDGKNGPAVFIGKPCDTTAVMELVKTRPALNNNIGLILTFFCAGVPSTRAAVSLLEEHGYDPDRVAKLRFRGAGWPGRFEVTMKDGTIARDLSYMESWSYLAKHRTYRCMICPDGLGERADIACGDAWNRTGDIDGPGISLAIARTSRGHDILLAAQKAGYVELKEVSSKEIILAQGLVHRRRECFGRMLAMKLLFIPTPRMKGFHLFRNWWSLPLLRRLRTVVGSLRRLVFRGYIFRGAYQSDPK